MKLFFNIGIFLIHFIGNAQLQLSEKATISILTCESGTSEIYAYFGHNALRVSDPVNQLDKVYNYGTFDFDTPNFYLKFCRGKLLYELSSRDFKYFPYHYYLENRGIKAQILSLSLTEAQKVYDFLENNALPQNKKYKYDFFYDNCATKMYEVIEKNIGTITYDYSDFPKNLTHRNLIHQHFPKYGWSTFGVDILLGSVIDKKIALKQYLFLPKYVFNGFKNAQKNNNRPIVKETKEILSTVHKTKFTGSLFGAPITLFSLLFLIASIISILGFKHKKQSLFLSNSIFVFYGFVGIILVFMMLGTDHTATYWNYNIFWANPIFLTFPFLKNHFLKKTITISSLAVLLLIAILGTQEFHLAVLPISLILVLRVLIQKH